MPNYDVINDVSGEFLYQKIGKVVDQNVVEEIRNYSKKMPIHAFADTENRLFPIYNEKVAATSAMYAKLQQVPAKVAQKIEEALDLFGIEVDAPSEKVAAAPDDDDFLFPEHRKVLIRSSEDVKAAEASLFNRAHSFDTKTLVYGARRLQVKAAEYGVELERDFRKLVGDVRCDVTALCRQINKRRSLVKTAEHREALEHLERSLKDSGAAFIDSFDDKAKIASFLLDVDEAAGISHRYDAVDRGSLSIKDPMSSVYNTDKTASDFVEMAGQEVPLEKLMALDPDMLADLVGEEFTEDIVGENGEIDPAEFQQTLSILPEDMQQDILSRLKGM